MAQIINITSEALQATIRRLLPSQQGFGEDLQATNVVTPIIDLTPSAEGSDLAVDLQRALSFDDLTEFAASASTATIANSPGFWRIVAGFSLKNTSADTIATIEITDGSTTKELFTFDMNANGDHFGSEFVDIIICLQSGETAQARTNNSRMHVIGTARQVADINGNTINPSGYTPQ